MDAMTKMRIRAHYEEMSREAGMCPNCRKEMGEEDGRVHMSPCVFCPSDGHSGCQHAHDI